MKIHLTKRQGNKVYPTLTACGTRPRRNHQPRIYSTKEFAFFADDLDMVCEKCLELAIASGRVK